MLHKENGLEGAAISSADTELSLPLIRSRCVLIGVEIKLSEETYPTLESQAEALQKVLTAFDVKFVDPEIASDVASALVTALIGEARLSDEELFRIQGGFKDLSEVSDDDADLGLLGLSISCEAGVEVLPGNSGAIQRPNPWQRIKLLHVNVSDTEDSTPAWERDPDFWKKDEGDLEELPEIEELDKVGLILEYEPDPSDPAIYCRLEIEDESTAEELDMSSWSSAESFLKRLELDSLPEIITATDWTIEDLGGDRFKVSNSRCSFALKRFSGERSSESDGVRPRVEVPASLPPAISKSVSMCAPPEFAIKRLFEPLGLGQISGVVGEMINLSKGEDSPPERMGEIIALHGSGDLIIEDQHILTRSQFETVKRAQLHLESTPVGSVLIEVNMGMLFSLCVCSPRDDEISSSDTPESLIEMRKRAASVNWKMLQAFANEFPAVGSDEDFEE